jgi:hypothetical protein
MSNLPVINAGDGRRQPREILLNFGGSIGGPAARVTVVPSRDEGTQASEALGGEGDRLVTKKTRDEDLPMFYMKRAEARNRLTTGAVVLTLFVIGVVFAGLGVMLWRINTTMTKATDTLQPRINTLMTTVDAAANNTVQTLENIMGSSEDGNFLTGMTVPQLIAMVNSTTRTMLRLEEILSHPQIQLALGGAALGGGAGAGGGTGGGGGAAMPTITLG